MTCTSNGNTLEVFVSRNPPRDATAFEWPPSAGDLSSVTVVQVGAPTAVSATRAASRAVATAPALASSAPRRPRRRLNTLQQLTLLAAGMLVGAALPGIDDGRRPIVGIGQAAEAASAPAAAEAAAGAASATVSPAAVPALPVEGGATSSVADDRVAVATIATASTPTAASTARAAVRSVPRDPRTRQVLQALRKYETAFSRMDAGATSAVWPSANRDELTRTFTAVREQRLWLHGCTVSGTGPTAAGTCRGTLRYRPRVGDHSTRLRHGTWRFALEQADDTWLISRVTVS